MRLIITIAFLLAGLPLLAQVDSVPLKNAMSALDRALVNKRPEMLQDILHEDCSFGHSNGWVQRKKDMLEDMRSGKLVYESIENNSGEIVSLNENWATVRINTEVGGIVNGTSFRLRLHVMQVWIRRGNDWLLLARQSAKL